MDPILLFFVLPLATIVISIALESLLNNPYLVSAIVFSVFLISAFTVTTTDFLIYTIIYTIIALITALIYDAIRRFINNNNRNQLPNSEACRICKCQRQMCSRTRR